MILPDKMILHIGTNGSTFYSVTEIVEEIGKLKQYILEQLPIVKLMISTPTLRTDKANANLINAEVTELLRTCKEKVITHPNIKEEHLDKYGLHINNVDTRMPKCQFLEHQIADSDYTLSGLSGSTTQNVEIPNKYSVDAKLLLKVLVQVIRTILL